MSTLSELTARLATGAVQVVDLTHTLDPDFPVIVLPPEFGQCAPFRIEEISAYDHRGPAWKWNNISMGEHTGTHFDAPSHWISGRDVPNGAVDEIDPAMLVGPVVVIDCSEGTAGNDDFELTPQIILDWEARHGLIPAGSWVLMRTDWSKRSGAAYLNMKDDGPHSPGPTPEAIRLLVHEREKFAASAPNVSAPMPGRGRITRHLIRPISPCTAPGAMGCNACAISTCCRRPARC